MRERFCLGFKVQGEPRSLKAGMRDWGLEISMTCDQETKRLGDIRLPCRHFERKREIFVIRGQVGKVQNGKPASRETFGHRHYFYFAALRSFDLVLLFQISHFLTYDVFLRSG